jgi:putative membrane-bound dehydrogenase-like protein
MKPVFPLYSLAFFSLLPAFAADAPKLPLINDPALKIEAFATYPDIETPTTVVGAPDGSVFVGNDPRDSRLSTKNPDCTVVRFSGPGADRKKTVFADKLYSPAGMAWHDGYLYLLHDPLLTRFKDTDGDGVADVREDLVTELGPEPHEGLNDHVVSGFALGMDGFFYISVGDKGVYRAKGKDGSTATLQGGGIVRVRPDGTELQVFSGGTRNHLEVDLDAYDRAFTLDNTDDGNGWWTRLNYHVESGYYGYPFFYKNDLSNGLITPGPQKAQPVPGAPAANERFLPALTDFGGGSPCGGLVYLSDGLPEKYRGKLLFSEWGQRKLSVIEVAKNGATFDFVKNEPLLEEDKGGSFRPMEMYVAADGSLLVSDWGYGGWKSPKQLGTVWRLTWPEAKAAPRLADEAKATIPELVAALNHPDRDQRLRAEWALVHRGAPAVPALTAELAKGQSELSRAHALWTLDLIAAATPDQRASVTELLRKTVTDTSVPVRVQAIRALGTRKMAAAAGEITNALGDPDAEVRLQAAIALGRIGAKPAAAALTKTLSDEDRWVRFAARAALAKIGDWAAVAPLLKKEDSRATEQAWLAFTYTFDAEAVAILKQTATDMDVSIRSRALDALGLVAYMPKDWDGHWWGTQPVKTPLPPNTIAWAGTAPALAALTTALEDWDTSVRLAAARAFTHFTMDDAGKSAAATLRTRLQTESEPAVRRQLIETLGVQKDPEALGVFTKIALDEKADADFRDTAIAAVANIGGEEAKRTIAALAGAGLSPAATRKVIESVGEMKVVEAAPALIPHATDPDPALRLVTLKSLASLGPKAKALDTFTAALADKDGKVVNAALDALTTLQDRAALPALLAFGVKNKTRKELIAALSAVPDPEAIPIFLNALRDNNSGVRRNAIGALKKMRAQSWPLIEQDLASGRIPAEFAPEIKNAFESGVIVKWKMLGPFENVWGAVHPPESEALAAGGKPDLTKKYVNAEGHTVGWSDVVADANTGHVDLGKIFKTNGMVCAYAYAEIEATEAGGAQFICGSDDQIAVWIGGTKVNDFGASRGFDPDKDSVPIQLQAGANQVLVKIGNLSGTWEFAARIPGFENGRFTPSKEPAPDVKQRNFALASKPDGTWLNPGDAQRGEKLFHDQTGALGGLCATCHAVRGKGGQIGPDLSAVAVNYRRPDLITSIHEPSKTIALGFEQFIVETKDGETLVGAIRQETGETLTLVGADAQPHLVKKTDVKARNPVPVSMMPQGITLGLKADDFVDLLAYLETLKGK